jgi:foldase protein PrsA
MRRRVGNMTRTLAALCAVFAVGGTLSGCGGDGVPGNAVARVGDDVIKRTTFDHWMNVAAKSAQAQTPTPANSKPAVVSIPKPPDFVACVANKRRTAPKPAKGQPKPTEAQFKTQCKQEYEGLRDQVLSFLISSQWIVNESDDQGVKATDAEIKKQFDTTKKQSFKKDADFQKFLRDSGMTQADVLFRVRIDTLTNKLRTKITKGKDKVSNAQIQSYYNKNKSRFAQPERRDLRIVLTKTKAKADEAKSALASGQSFRTVAKKFSIDQASKAQGGVLRAVAKGQQEKALDEAVFKAKKGALTGPIKTQFGYYVFKVQKITAAKQQTLAEARTTIRQLLQSQNQQKALEKFIKDFRDKWKGKTNCRSGFVIQDCKNAPKPKPASTAPPGSSTPAPPAQQGTTPAPQQ